MRSLWPTGGLWRHRDFLKLWSAETISLRLAGRSARDAARRDPRPRRQRLRGRGARDGGVPAVHPLHAAGRRVGRPAAAATDPDRRRLRARGAPRDDPDRLRRGRTHARRSSSSSGSSSASFQVFFDVAYQSYLPSLVEREQIIEGNSKLEISRSAAQVGGPGLGGVLVQIFTAPYAVLVDAVSFVGSGLFLLRIRKVEDAVEVATVDGRKVSLWTDLKEGLRFVLGNPNLRAQAGCTATSNFFSSLAFSIFLVFAVRELHLSAGTIGLIFSVGAAGSLVAAFTSMRISQRALGSGRRRSSWRCCSGRRSCSSRSRRQGTRQFRSSWLLSSSSGSRSSSTTSSQVSYRQAICPPRLQGRMNSVMRFMVWGTIPSGTLAGGALATLGRPAGDDRRRRDRRRVLVPLAALLPATAPARDARAR